jgi:hypothetical protein
MPKPRVSDDEFAALCGRMSPTAVAAHLSIAVRNVQQRRGRLNDRGFGIKTVPEPGYENRVPTEYRDAGWTFPREQRINVDTGSVIIFSDAHYWPGIVTTAHKALLAVIKSVRPRLTIANGDIFDGVSTSRHDPFGWCKRPSVKEEMDACIERMGEVEQAVPKGCELRWTIGNHDIRFERSLATRVSDFEGIGGFRLADHFPAWQLAWSLVLNPEAHIPVMVKHRNANGVHAAYNNAMKGGYHIVTGHTHALEVKPYGDYRGRRYGVQGGCLLDIDAPQTEYAENNPSHMCPGFVVLTFKDGELLPPEMCAVVNGRAFFRGEVVA